MDPLDSEIIRKSLTTARNNGFRNVKLKSGSSQFHAVMSEEAIGWGDSWPEEGADMISGSQVAVITSPVVGYVKWISESVKVGVSIQEGQQIGEVLALGISNEITAPAEGTVLNLLVQEGSPVEFGKALLEIEIR